MNASQQFYALNNTIASRQKLEEILQSLMLEKSYVEASRLLFLLEAFPNENAFEIDLSTTGLGTPDFNDIISQIDEESDDCYGLAKAVSPNDVYDIVTKRIIEQLKEATGRGYVKKWGNFPQVGFMVPHNFASMKPYRGINAMLLARVGMKPMENPFFLTFNQVKKLKGKVRKGAIGREVIYFNRLFLFSQKKPALKFSTTSAPKMIGWLKKNRSKIPALKVSIAEHGEAKGLRVFLDTLALPLLKYYKVFNGKDIEGIDFKLDEWKTGKVSGAAEKSNSDPRIQSAEKIVDHYPKPQPELKHGGTRAFYSPSNDLVQMPPYKTFDSGIDYYRTLFHEYTHSTMIPSRLARDMSGRFGDSKYAFEELIAEWGAVFLSSQAGIIWHNNANHSEYLKNWQLVIEEAEKDNKFLMRAATLAQKAADFILQPNAEGISLFLRSKPTKKAEKKSPKEKTSFKNKALESTSKDDKTTVDYKFAVVDPISGKPFPFVDLKKAEAFIRKDIHSDFPSLDTSIFRLKKNAAGRLSTDGKVKTIKGKVPKGNPKQLKMALAKPAINTTIRNTIPKGLRRMSDPVEKAPLFNIEGATGAFLQDVERKHRESVVVVLSTPKGTGKTTSAFKWINDLAKTNSVLFASLEEHHESNLFIDKRNEYIDRKVWGNITTVSDIDTKAQLDSWIQAHDVVVFDSWQKLIAILGRLDLDQDFRKKFDGKLLIFIVQQTVDGKVKGGSNIVFDGDVIVMGEKGASFKDNYLYFDKHRYTRVDLSKIRYNIASHMVYDPTPKATEKKKTVISSGGRLIVT